MKRFLLIFLSLAMILSLLSCSSSIGEGETVDTVETKTEQETTEDIHDPTGFAVGFARVEANPKHPTSLGGYGTASTRLSETVLDDICISCVAISDGEEKILIYSVDFIGVGTSTVESVASRVEKNLGIPADHVLMNASHTHSAPEIRTKTDSITVYMKTFYEKAYEAAELAVADLDRAEIKIGRADATGLAHVRRYMNADGTYAGGTALPDGLKADEYYHETEADNEMQILYFDRANQKDVVMMNWQCHPTAVGGSNDTRLSADWVGAFRKEVEKELDVHCSFIQGAAGSMVNRSKIQGENAYSGDHVSHGKKVAQVLVDAVSSLTPAESGKIKLAQKTIETKVAEHQVADYGETQSPTFWAVSFGEVAFATAPYEMDHNHGKQVKNESPYAFTFMSAYTNGSYSYIPHEAAWANGGYEVTKCRYNAGTGEMYATEIIGLLNQIYEN